MLELLKRCYPNYSWNETKWKDSQKNWKISQKILLNRVKSIFPGKMVLLDYLHPKLFYENSNKRMQLDIYVEELKLCFEYQGRQHYMDGTNFHGYQQQVMRDFEKKSSCKSEGIKIIYVPYWWDYKRQTLEATILEVSQ
jgi:hypothetical protein